MNGTDTTMPGTTDTRDMIVVHTALLREIRLAPAAVARAARAGSDRRRAAAARHLRLVLDLLDHHHHGEDELLLPLLRARVPRSSAAPIDAGEQQHARIEELVVGTRAGLDRWTGGAADAASELAGTLTALHAALEPHLRGEERDILPLAAVHLDADEWRAIGDAGFRAVPKAALLLVFGMFAHEGDPQVLRGMLAHAPAPARVLVPRIAPGVYARRCAAVHGTARP